MYEICKTEDNPDAKGFGSPNASKNERLSLILRHLPIG